MTFIDKLRRDADLLAMSRGLEAADIIEEMTKALKAWSAYDTLLRTITTEQAAIYEGQIPEVDAAYDACVAATFAALRKAEGPPMTALDNFRAAIEARRNAHFARRSA